MDRKNNLYEFVRDRMKERRVLVLGDVMLDKYYFSEVQKISQEAPVPVARITNQQVVLGGAANVANNLALLGCTTYLAGRVGNDYHRTVLENLLTAQDIEHHGVICAVGPTTTKLRVMGGHQQMIRLDFEETDPLMPAAENELCAYLNDAFSMRFDAVIISDYAKGVCTPNVCQHTIALCRQYGIPVIIDPKGNEWEKYANADYVTPNVKEINAVMQQRIYNQDEDISVAAKKLVAQYGIKNLLVTRSEKGLSLFSDGNVVHIPTSSQEVFDVSGAGDTVIAVFALALAGHSAPKEAAYLANLAAGIVVKKMGTYAICREELLSVLWNQDITKIKRSL